MKNRSQAGSKRARKPLPHRQQRTAHGSAALSPEIASTFSQALAAHQAGRLEEAGNLYRKVLETRPEHFDSLQLLGLGQYQRGEHCQGGWRYITGLKNNTKARPAYDNLRNAVTGPRAPGR